MPKVSIIIPIYNVEKYLDRCVQSVINQTLQDIEIILVDDESPDGCPQMCDEYARKDNRVKVVHKKNAGLGFARNSGLEVATGEYVTFLDSDDFVDKDTYRQIYENILKNELEICYFTYCRYLNDGTIIHESHLGDEKLYIGKEQTERFMLDMVGKVYNNPDSEYHIMSVCFGVYKTDIIKRNNVKFVSEREIASEDLIFHIDLLPYITRIGYLPKEFYYYYVNTGSITFTYSDAKYNSYIKLIETVKSKLSERYDAEKYEPHYYTQVLRVYKMLFRFESINKASFLCRRKRISALCKVKRVAGIYDKKIKGCFSRADRLLINCMKHNLSLIIMTLYTIAAKKYVLKRIFTKKR